MSKENKSITEEALNDINLIQESLKTNTKDIFRSLMKEEIESVMKSALTEDDYEEEDIDLSDESSEEDITVGGEDTSDVEDLDGGVDGEDEVADETPTEDEPTVDSEIDGVSDDTDLDFGDETEDVLDYTDKSDDEVISIYKKMTGSDEVEVVGNDVTIKDSDSGNEYVIKMGGDAPTVEPDMAEEVPTDSVEDEGETMYEITLSEDMLEDENVNESEGAHGDYPTTATAPKEIEGVKASQDADSGDNLDGGFVEDEATSGDAHGDHIMETEDECIEEAIPKGTAEARRVPGRETPIKGAGAKENTPKISENVEKYKEAIKGYTELKSENKQIKEAFVQLRGHLQNALLYNENLTHIVKLFTENTTSKTEKSAIVKEFSDLDSIEGSKKLYETYKDKLKGNKVVVESKIENKLGSSSSSKVIQKTVFQKENDRIMNLMERVEGKNLL